MASWSPPDRKNPSHYPNTTTPLQFAWEFLRRNREYQRLWNWLIGPDYDAAELNASWPGARPLPGIRFRRPLHSSPRVPFADKFHIATYPPPPPSENTAKLHFDAHSVRYQKRDVPGEVHGTLGKDEIIIWFNFDWPIASQLANDKKLIDHTDNAKVKS